MCSIKVSSSPDPFRVMGIDPGLTKMGWGVVEEVSGRRRVLASGTVKTAPGPLSVRLHSAHLEMQKLIESWHPATVAMERVFLKTNRATGVPALQAAGVAMLAAAQAGLDVHEYSPASVKQAVVGNGAAAKEQVRFMVSRLLGEEIVAGAPDASDALAIALTHLNSRGILAMQAIS